MEHNKARALAKNLYSRMLVRGINKQKNEVTLKMDADLIDDVEEAMLEE